MHHDALQRLRLDDVRTDADTHARCSINDRTAAQYAAALTDGHELPPVIVFDDEQAYHLADGFHRLEAHRLAGRDEIEAYVYAGTAADAAWYALGAHRPYGLRLTNADKQRAARRAILMRPDLSNRAIAEHVGVSDKTVARQRGIISARAELPHLPLRTGRDGKHYPVKSPDLAQPDCEPPSDDDSPPDADPPRDRAGQAIPNLRIVRDFDREPELAELDAAVVCVQATVLAALRAGDPLYADIDRDSFSADCRTLRHWFKHARPYAVCPLCQGQCCPHCHHRGWINQTTYEAGPNCLNAKKKPA